MRGENTLYLICKKLCKSKTIVVSLNFLLYFFIQQPPPPLLTFLADVSCKEVENIAPSGGGIVEELEAIVI